MSTPLNPARPGDIISASSWNLVINSLNDALLRLEALESGGGTGSGLLVSQLVPPGPYRIGDTLQVFGQNFQFAIGATRVFFNSMQVLNMLPSSTDSRLDFAIPNVPGVTESGTQVDLVVLNQTQSVTRQVTLRPRLNPLQGMIMAEWISVDPATVLPGGPATFVYRITSGTNNAAVWSLNALVDVVANPAAWNSQLRIRDTAGNNLNPAQVSLAPGQQIDVQVHIPALPTGTNNVTFGVSISATSAGVTGSSGLRQFVVGTLTPPPDLTMTLTTVPALSNGALVGSTLTVPGAQQRPLAIAAVLTLTGVYNVTRSVLGGATGWTVNLDAGTLDNFTITAADLTTGSAQRLLRFSVAATGAATTPGQIQIQVQRQGVAGSRVIALNTVRS